MKELPDYKVRAWARLVRAQRIALERVEKTLKQANMPPLAWYDVLLELERTDAGMRQFELGQRMLLSKHNLSRLLDRMVIKGLVKRVNCPEDGRGSVVQITRAGRDLRKAMWPVYAAGIDTAFAARLGADEAREFSNTLKKLLD